MKLSDRRFVDAFTSILPFVFINEIGLLSRYLYIGGVILYYMKTWIVDKVCCSSNVT